MILTVQVFLIDFSETVIVGNCFSQIINITVVATLPYYIRNNPDNYAQYKKVTISGYHIRLKFYKISKLLVISIFNETNYFTD